MVMITMVHVAGLLYNLHVSRGAFKIRFRKTSNGRHAVGAPAEQAEAYNSSILDSSPTLLLIIVAFFNAGTSECLASTTESRLAMAAMHLSTPTAMALTAVATGNSAASNSIVW